MSSSTALRTGQQSGVSCQESNAVRGRIYPSRTGLIKFSLLRLFSLLLIPYSLFLIPELAHAEYFDIQHFQTDVQMKENGQLAVTETIDVQFTENRHGIFRDIQTQGIQINVLGVTDEKDVPRPYTIEGFSEGTRVKIGDADVFVNGRQVYKINYDVKKAIRFFPDHDELYWNATGNAWPVDIKSAVSSVRLPASVKGVSDLKFKCFTGAAGSVAEGCAYQYDEGKNTVEFRSSYPLSAYQGLTIVVSIPPNLLERPTTLEVKSAPAGAGVFLDNQHRCDTPCLDDTVLAGTYDLEIKKFGYIPSEKRKATLTQGQTTVESFDLPMTLWFAITLLVIVLLMLGIVFEPVYTYWKKGRDPKGRGVLVPQYDPPDEIPPAEMGTLADEKVNLHDITATLVDLAVRGFIIIKVLPDAKGFIFKEDDYELIKVADPHLRGRRSVTPFEKLLMEKIFSSGQTKKISDLHEKFYKHLPTLQNMLYQSLVEKGYFPKSPAAVRNHYLIKGFIVLAVGFGLLFIALFPISFALFINGFLSFIFAPFMPCKTPKGTAAREHIMGFKHYLEIAEKDRLKFQEKQNIFYEFLPYAMTLKIADKWSRAFEGVFDQPPDWYQGAGAGAFHPSAFTRNIQTMSHSMSSAFASHPSSSGGGGGFSGGSSGGGGGGGGGGSW